MYNRPNTAPCSIDRRIHGRQLIYTLTRQLMLHFHGDVRPNVFRRTKLKLFDDFSILPNQLWSAVKAELRQTLP